MATPSKVFGIGFQKTGTTTLAAALYILGFNVTGYFGTHDADIAEHVYDQAYDLADRFDAAQDTPWPVLYQELDRRYPASKFILTVRPADKWIRSVVKHFKRQDIPAHAWIYGEGRAQGNEERYVERYLAHNRAVQAYFEDRPDDLLVIDITSGAGWEQLCPFLGVVVPSIQFPAQNSSKERSRRIMQRGLRFLERRLRPEMTLSLANQMYQGVSSAFVRDIVHFHCTMSERALAGVERMSDADFVLQQPSLTRSACDLLVEQIADEIELLEQLAPDNSSRPAAAESEAPPTKASLCHQLRSLHTLLRMHVSNLTDNACNAKADGVNAYVWELFMQLLHNGIERRVLLRMALAQAGIPLETESFIPFFRPDAEPARADKRPQELALVASH